MKQTTLILLVIIFNTTLSFSQDIITTKAGEDILAKILEISKTEIKFKKYDNPDGPLFTLLKSDVLMIRYENGSKDIFTEDPKSNAVSPPNFSSPNLNTQDNKLFYAAKAEKYRKMKSTGTTLTVLGGVLYVVGYATLSNATTYSSGSSNNVGTGVVAYLLGVAGLGAGIPLWIVGGHQHRKYNKKLEGLSFRFNMNPQRKGLTLAYRF